jgi:hypothetical protein
MCKKANNKICNPSRKKEEDLNKDIFMKGCLSVLGPGGWLKSLELDDLDLVSRPGF